METENKNNNSAPKGSGAEKKAKRQVGSNVKSVATGIGGVAVGTLISGFAPMPEDDDAPVEMVEEIETQQPMQPKAESVSAEETEPIEDVAEEVEEVSEIQPISHYSEEDVAEIYPIGGGFIDTVVIVGDEDDEESTDVSEIVAESVEDGCSDDDLESDSIESDGEEM